MRWPSTAEPTDAGAPCDLILHGPGLEKMGHHSDGDAKRCADYSDLHAPRHDGRGDRTDEDLHPRLLPTP